MVKSKKYLFPIQCNTQKDPYQRDRSGLSASSFQKVVYGNKGRGGPPRIGS